MPWVTLAFIGWKSIIKSNSLIKNFQLSKNQKKDFLTLKIKITRLTITVTSRFISYKPPRFTSIVLKISMNF